MGVLPLIRFGGPFKIHFSMSETPKDFVRQIISDDGAAGKHAGRVHTRFPPEPNGYLHIGHA